MLSLSNLSVMLLTRSIRSSRERPWLDSRLVIVEFEVELIDASRSSPRIAKLLFSLLYLLKVVKVYSFSFLEAEPHKIPTGQ